ncbi:MAG TPA: crossover junction endodeoxyribonuclease RuvC [Candidatus Megaira endosymbiont of Hartmannula sinica]|nr:crossover junction endodeoxyribonuclease RuvC [Candidatus Megaera endosymbiont of Hartmannula sinica]
MSLIFGIDPALAKTGWAVVRHDKESNKFIYISSGLIKTSSTDEMPFRLAYIFHNIRKILSEHELINKIAIEKSFINNNAVSSLKLAAARGAIMAAIGYKKNIIFNEISPNKIKRSISLSGHSDKKQIISMVRLIISSIPDDYSLSEDEADAIACAYAMSI